MKIAELEISNIKAIEHICFRPGTITRIVGANETGKSSLLDAILAVFEGGSDPGWLRIGATRGFIRWDLDDGTRVIKEIIRHNGGVQTNLEVLDPRGVPIPGPQTFISRLGRSWAVDPGKILTLDTATAAGRKALIAYLLQVMPISFSLLEVNKAVQEQVPLSRQEWDLAELGKLRKQIEDYRRVVGGHRNAAEAAAAQLRKSLKGMSGGGEQTDWASTITEIEGEVAALRAARDAREHEIRKAEKTELQGITDDYQARERKIREQFQRDLAELESKKVGEMRALATQARDAMKACDDDFAPLLGEKTVALSIARERAQTYAAAAGVREQMNIQDEVLTAKLTEYADLDETLQRLDALRKSKLDNLPVPGLSFEAEQVFVAGVPWHHVNKAQRYRIAVQIAALAAGDLQFLVVDAAECFDAANLAELEAAAAEAGFQLITASVDDEAKTLRIVDGGSHAAR